MTTLLKAGECINFMELIPLSVLLGSTQSKAYVKTHTYTMLLCGLSCHVSNILPQLNSSPTTKAARLAANSHCATCRHLANKLRATDVGLDECTCNVCQLLHDRYSSFQWDFSYSLFLLCRLCIHSFLYVTFVVAVVIACGMPLDTHACCYKHTVCRMHLALISSRYQFEQLPVTLRLSK